MWPASVDRAAEWPRLTKARGSLRHSLALTGASGVRASWPKAESNLGLRHRHGRHLGRRAR
eukprot:scaffold65972_cov45-Phaeocystis_antarctica.AAC.1